MNHPPLPFVPRPLKSVEPSGHLFEPPNVSTVFNSACSLSLPPSLVSKMTFLGMREPGMLSVLEGLVDELLRTSP